ncbi:uncharacterized protein Z519_03612 [Cladophialophora bantiana CBS 173.52]|uniref:Oxidoreductase acuF-like C2H2 type zinc-finger domain-containing protein n=1 Tax=Cladophialophora bantiana (strain ATCC 10958 / CBS 173.52 / CDC B-1940 / NIH 8579) TaxID=1442370 RepID=A0A0D2EYK3_CLAB1|nr:uncharacterized protein Z519_03612 [Cladophialophora bantiana CBS 173.52]KIW95031.1 hypothetical protein Z519_03612 [Cladophialophora bantiana CBS 173.52]
MTSSISAAVVDCLKSFDRLMMRAELAAHANDGHRDSWAYQHGRLQIWAGNIGAHQTGNLALDYPPRDASHGRTQTIKLLERLRRTLEDADDFLTEGEEKYENILADDGQETELQQIYCGLVNTIDYLFQLSMIICRPAAHDRLLGTKWLDAVVFESFDRDHAANKYLNASKIVIDGLGTAISQRRGVLKYRERHRSKLGKGIEHVVNTWGDGEENSDAVSVDLSETIATNFKEPHIDFEETASNSGASQTSYTPSLLDSSDKITVPYPPKESSSGKPFECPYCFSFTTVSNRRSWIRHVFRDLMLYVCVFHGCSARERLYESRREWFQHLRIRRIPSIDPDKLKTGSLVATEELDQADSNSSDEEISGPNLRPGLNFLDSFAHGARIDTSGSGLTGEAIKEHSAELKRQESGAGYRQSQKWDNGSDSDDNDDEL